MECPTCSGSGWSETIDADRAKTAINCPTCNGTGVIEERVRKQIDALAYARSQVETYDYRINDGANEQLARHAYEQAMMYAAIAQAEALKRIADGLEFTYWAERSGAVIDNSVL